VEPLDVLSRVSRFRWIGMGRESGLEPLNVTGRSHVSTQKSEGNLKAPGNRFVCSHCQRMLTRDGSMTGLNLQSLSWGDDGELAADDRLDLVNVLLTQSLPEVQVELIRTVERIAIAGATAMTEVSVS
jgi:hypothetical protein